MSIKSARGMSITTKALSSDTWERPSDWLPLPAVANTDQKVVALHAVYPNDPNFCAMQCRTAYTVDWGDGVVENFGDNVIAYHQYDYNNVALAGTESSRGYKQAVVIITPNGGNLTSVDFNIAHNTSGLAIGYSSGWLEIVISSSNLTYLYMSAATPQARHSRLEHFSLLSKSAGLTSYSQLFMYCSSLEHVSSFPTTNVTNLANTFAACYSLTYIPLLDLSSATSVSSMFSGCYALRIIPELNVTGIPNLSSMFANCPALEKVKLGGSLASATNISGIFSSCTALIKVEMPTDTLLVTNFGNTFLSCNKLRSAPTLDISSATTITGMFGYNYAIESVAFTGSPTALSILSSAFVSCYNLRSVSALPLSAATTTLGMFQNCWSLESVTFTGTSSSLTTMSTMFNTCPRLLIVPAIDCSHATSSSSYTSMMNGCGTVNSVLATGFKYTFSVANLKMDATALNALYTNLGTVSGQTITVTGNYGTLGDDISIATAKGWTVTG